MNHYNWIVLKIQDLSTSDFVHSVICNDGYGDTYTVSEKPLQYFVSSDDMDGLLKAKEIMEAACNSIYEVSTDTDDYETIDGYEEYITKKVPAYFDNFTYYNMTVAETCLKANIAKAKRQKKAAPNYYESSPDFKKIFKERFQVYQEFAGGLPTEIELYDPNA